MGQDVSHEVTSVGMVIDDERTYPRGRAARS
jgi:hypothetical protein